ncbi:alpha/beta fold hydrolase [Streptomyces sp. NBC_01233]|uniref:alpha/beta fold hydrolase n=1 Tax=Streptomyces sp. NBC_01233 TaxID=2903787 RepID=UPI002E0DA64D|nr:alpha/beta hydrolase [Streptomyces sp. NBC_01233]
MRSRNTRKAPLLAASLAAATLSALTPATALAASTASDASTAKDPLRQYTQQKLQWKRCDAKGPDTFQCATLKVPLDYSDPGGKTIGLAISRLKAGSAKARHGVLLLNPGGPGAPGLQLPADPLMKFPAEVKRRYDLVGFDPRGAGQSSPVSCGLTAEEQADQPYKAETFTKDVDRARTVAEKCRARAGDKLPHLTTRNSARDMDVIRAALGEETISYLGISYGTYLGAVYMQLFPQRADRIVLDSATNPTRIYRGMFQDMAKAAEQAFTRWTAWTARRHTTYGLGDTPAKVRKTYWDLIARANRKPVLFEGQTLTGDGIRADNRTFFHVQKAAERITGLKKGMLTVAGGEGHGVLYAPDSSPCADKAVTVYLTTGRLPAKDLTCQATAGQKEQPRTFPVPTPPSRPGTHDRLWP